jgi:hypothetical protein
MSSVELGMVDLYSLLRLVKARGAVDFFLHRPDELAGFNKSEERIQINHTQFHTAQSW